VTVTIDITNIAPVASNDVYDVTHDSTLSVLGLVTPAPEDIDPLIMGLLDNDSDADGDFLQVNLITTTTNGLLTLNSLGQFIYEPNAGFVGTDSFTYKVFDGLDESELATVIINVQNTAPIAENDSFSTVHGVPIWGEIQQFPDPEAPPNAVREKSLRRLPGLTFC